MGDYGSAMTRGNPDGGSQGRPKGVPRANVQQLKLMGQGHPTGLTPNLLKLFEARPMLEHKPPVQKRKLPAYTGMAQFVSRFAEPGDPEYAPPVPTCETKAEKKDRIRKLKLEQGADKVAKELQNYDPQSDPNTTSDPYKTLFVARLNYETSESRVKREFEAYGPIKRVGACGKSQYRWSYSSLNCMLFSYCDQQASWGEISKKQWVRCHHISSL
ncbi:hypothetical protein ACQJBY_001324 [Aegilops geniculata]|uniref:U1 small nuclear ribonucleoprotein of 70kDa N-terminal domain-containing protein n=1 Tax=Aegilops tauschii subsp. strangulata TaxID=200361 RepID=A0A452Y7G0_AEGTS